MKITPGDYHVVTPWIISKNTVGLVQFMTDVFGAKETPGSRMVGADGKIAHVEVTIGDSAVMAFDAKDDWPETPAFLRLYVADVDATIARAVAAGAAAITNPTDLAFGDRVGRVRDPWNNLWWIHQHTEDVDAETMMKRFADPKAMEAMRYVERSLNDAMRV
jgi:PhnB protein